MKRFIALLTAVLILFSLCSLYAVADGIDLYQCVTWVYLPVRPTYIADYYKKGDIPVPPDYSQFTKTNGEEPYYETEEYSYKFLGWKYMATAGEINDYYDRKPGLEFHEPFVQEAFAPIDDKDVVYCAVFRLVPKRFDVNHDRDINIHDVSSVLNYIKNDPQQLEGDVDKDRLITIRDATWILAFLKK